MTFGFPNSKKNSFRGNCMRKYGKRGDLNFNKGINSWVAILIYLTLKIAGQVISGKCLGNFRHFLGQF